MRAINHALTGTLIGLTIGKPVLALSLALASHFICDVIPHHGSLEPDDKVIASPLFLKTLLVDALLCVILIGILIARQPTHWLLASICAFLAASPDALSINRFLSYRAHRKYEPGPLVAWATGIQWFARPIGAVVEAIWFVACIALLVPFLA